MNDRSATTTSAGAPRSPGARSRTFGALADLDPRVGPQPLVELAVADVDGHDRGRPALEQAVGEPAGGGAERRGPGGPPPSTSKRSRAASSFSPPRPTKRGRGPRTRDGLAGRDEAGRLVGRRAADGDPARRRCRPGPARGWGPGPAGRARRRGGAARSGGSGLLGGGRLAGAFLAAAFLAAPSWPPPSWPVAFLAAAFLAGPCAARRPSWPERWPCRAATRSAARGARGRPG